MKDSGIEWIGMIPADWNIVRIGNQYTERKTKVSDRDYPPLSVTMKGILPQLASAAKTDAHDDRKLVCKGDFAINSRSDRRGSCGISAYDGSVSLINTILQPRDEMNPEYYDWLFHSPMFSDEFYKWGHGIVDDLWTTNWQDMKRIAIPEPPLEEQQRIADYLGKRCAEIDAVIERTKATIEEYKRLRQAIITDAVTKGVHGTRSMKYSGIVWTPQIAADWHISRVGLHYNIILGKMLCDKQLQSEYTLEDYFCAANVHFDGVATNGLKKMWFSPEEKEIYSVCIGDLLVVEGGAGAGGAAIVAELANPTYIQNSIMIVRGKHSQTNRYIRYWIECLVKQGYIDVVCNKATIPHFTKDKLASMPIPVMEESEMTEIADYLDKKCAQLDALIEKKTALLAELEAYKKSVIYEYVTGKKECCAVEQPEITIIYPYFPATLSTKKARFAQAVLMSRILDKCRTKMGRVKLEKMLYTIETSIGFDFDTEYVRQAAGPLDESIYDCEAIISRRNKWYTMKTSKYGVSYTPTKDSGQYKKYYDKYFADYDSEIERIIGIFMDYDADQAEIVATLFAAWNDFVIDRKEFTDEQLVDEVLNNWNDSKKRFSRDVWLRAIEQMRQNNIIPKGYGKRTVIKS